MNLTNPPLTRGLGLTKSFDRRGKVPGTPTTRGLAETVSFDGREQAPLDRQIKEIGVRASATSSELGEVTASSLIRFRSVAAVSGADASIAIQVRASVNDAFEEAGIYLDANVTGLGGASRIRLRADNIVIDDGTDESPVFEIVGGVLYLRDVVLVKKIDDNVVETSNIQNNAVTQVAAAEATSPSSGDVVEVTITRTAGTNAIILALALIDDFTRASSFATPSVTRLRIFRDVTTLYDHNYRSPVVGVSETSDAINQLVLAGNEAIFLVDEANVSGSFDYTLNSSRNCDFAFIAVLEIKR